MLYYNYNSRSLSSKGCRFTYNTFANQSWMPSNYFKISLTELVLKTTSKENSIIKKYDRLADCHFHKPESLLPCSIPNLQFHRLSSNIDNFRTELYTDGMTWILLNWKGKMKINTERTEKGFRKGEGYCYTVRQQDCTSVIWVTTQFIDNVEYISLVF